MDYVPPINGNLADPNRPYINANPVGGIEGSIPPAAAIEHVMREVVNFITAAGLTPSSADLTQLEQAVKKSVTNYKDAEVLTANRVLTAADAGKYFSIGANNLTITLPNPATLTKGAKFLITNPSYTGCSISTPAGDILDITSDTTISSISVLTKSEIEIVAISTTRFHSLENVQSSLLSANGYLRLASGAIIQWGNGQTAAGGSVAVSFPITYPNAVKLIVVSDITNGSAAGNNLLASDQTPTTSGFTAWAFTTAGAGLSSPFYWVSLGN